MLYQFQRVAQARHVHAPRHLELVQLSTDDIPQIMRLQGRIVESLGEHTDYIHIKTPDDYTRILMREGVMIGAFNDNGRLMAQSVIRLPDRNNPDAGMIDMPLPGNRPEDHATFEGVLVDPDTRGEKLMLRMACAWLDCMRDMGRRHALGLITRENYFSWRVFLEAGCLITGAGFDPSDNSTVYYAHRDLRQCNDTLAAMRLAGDALCRFAMPPETPLRIAQQHFNRGYVGVGHTPTDQLVMTRRR